MSDSAAAGKRWIAENTISVLWGLALVAALINQAAGAVKAALPEPVAQQEITAQEAARRLTASPPRDGRSLVLFAPSDVSTVRPSPDSIYFGYRLQYLVYPQRVDRFYFPWDGVDSESYSDVYLCDDLMLLGSGDVDWHSGTVYRLRTPIAMARLRGTTR